MDKEIKKVVEKFRIPSQTISNVRKESDAKIKETIEQFLRKITSLFFNQN